MFLGEMTVSPAEPGLLGLEESHAGLGDESFRPEAMWIRTAPG